MEENKKENEIKEIKAEVVETGEKKYNQENLTKSIILAAMILILMITHKIFEWTPMSGNLPWFIVNSICVVGAAFVLVMSAVFFFKVTMNNLKKDIPSFCVSLAALVLSALGTIIWSIHAITNLIGLF